MKLIRPPLHCACDGVRHRYLLGKAEGASIILPRVPLQQHRQTIAPEVSASKDVFVCDQSISHMGDILVYGHRLDRGRRLREPRRSQVYGKVQR